MKSKYPVVPNAALERRARRERDERGGTVLVVEYDIDRVPCWVSSFPLARKRDDRFLFENYPALVLVHLRNGLILWRTRNRNGFGLPLQGGVVRWGGRLHVGPWVLVFFRRESKGGDILKARRFEKAIREIHDIPTLYPTERSTTG